MRRPIFFKTSMPGFADDSEWSNSNSGSGAQRSSVNCAPEVSRSALPRRSPPTANAGGGRPDTSDCTPRCRTATSTGSEYRGLPANLNRPNRRKRTRTSGGVGGERTKDHNDPVTPIPNNTPYQTLAPNITQPPLPDPDP